MTVLKKNHVIWVALLLTVGLTIHTYFNDDKVNAVVAATKASAIDYSRDKNQVLEFLKPVPVAHREVEQKRTFYSPIADVFDLYVPPQKRAAVKIVSKIKPKRLAATEQATSINIAPNLPTHPALPFVYLGKLLGDDEFIVYLSFQGKSLIVKEGDTIQQIYKIDEIEPPYMQVTYLPMNIIQRMAIGEP